MFGFFQRTAAVVPLTPFPSPDPPTVMIAADLDGGGRFYTQLTDGDPDTVTFEMPVELTFRRFHEGAGLANYFWKFRPVLGG